jgi:iron complex transport system substrate-binding protein
MLSLSRRAALACLPGVPLLLPPARLAAQPAWPRQVTDLLGRTVTIPAKPRAVLLGEGFQLVNLALVHPDPASILVGIGGDRRRVDPLGDAAYRRAFPALDRVPELTSAVGQGFGAERALSLRPDLVILSAWQARSDEMKRTASVLEQRGVPVIYIDIFEQPVRNTVPTIRLLGAALGEEERAEAYTGFYEARRERIVKRIAESGQPGPRVFFSAFPGRWPCCWSPGPAAGDGMFLATLGARNVAEAWLPTPRGGTVAAERVLMSGAEVFIGTGIYLPDDSQGIQVGAGATPDQARTSLEAVLAAPEFRLLPAVRARRAHGLWNPFNGAAVNIVAFEAMARWIRPELFGDLDPAATLAELNARFPGVLHEGTYWTSLA